jgi:hypothetical protein
MENRTRKVVIAAAAALTAGGSPVAARAQEMVRPHIARMAEAPKETIPGEIKAQLCRLGAVEDELDNLPIGSDAYNEKLVVYLTGFNEISRQLEEALGRPVTRKEVARLSHENPEQCPAL